ncbi:MAG: hypothetical protein CM15mP103_09730 [Gammaproteobacteria bacterium]|nr:MAG: hypothetical protein CM15mP103_09730 [Gammaproteobacteria bacterium]
MLIRLTLMSYQFHTPPQGTFLNPNLLKSAWETPLPWGLPLGGTAPIGPKKVPPSGRGTPAGGGPLPIVSGQAINAQARYLGVSRGAHSAVGFGGRGC